MILSLAILLGAIIWAALLFFFFYPTLIVMAGILCFMLLIRIFYAIKNKDKVN
jgi:hypothetical protein